MRVSRLKTLKEEGHRQEMRNERAVGGGYDLSYYIHVKFHSEIHILHN